MSAYDFSNDYSNSDFSSNSTDRYKDYEGLASPSVIGEFLHNIFEDSFASQGKAKDNEKDEESSHLFSSAENTTPANKPDTGSKQRSLQDFMDILSGVDSRKNKVDTVKIWAIYMPREKLLLAGNSLDHFIEELEELVERENKRVPNRILVVADLLRKNIASIEETLEIINTYKYFNLTPTVRLSNFKVIDSTTFDEIFNTKLVAQKESEYLEGVQKFIKKAESRLKGTLVEHALCALWYTVLLGGTTACAIIAPSIGSRIMIGLVGTIILGHHLKFEKIKDIDSKQMKEILDYIRGPECLGNDIEFLNDYYQRLDQFVKHIIYANN